MLQTSPGLAGSRPGAEAWILAPDKKRYSIEPQLLKAEGSCWSILSSNIIDLTNKNGFFFIQSI